MADALWTIVVIVVLAAIAAPLALVWLFARQVFPHRPLLTAALIGLGAFTMPLGLAAWGAAAWIQLRSRRRAPMSSGDPVLGRSWARLVDSANGAAARFANAVAAVPPGPLHDRMAELRADVDETLVTAAHLAAEGTRLDAARRDVERALARHSKRTSGTPSEALRQSLAAQRRSAETLARAARDTKMRLEELVARLDGITACAVEMSLAPRLAPHDAAALPDAVESLRLAWADLDHSGAPQLASH